MISFSLARSTYPAHSLCAYGLNGSLCESRDSVKVQPLQEYQVARENDNYLNGLNLLANVSVLDEQLWPSPPSKFQWN